MSKKYLNINITKKIAKMENFAFQKESNLLKRTDSIYHGLWK